MTAWLSQQMKSFVEEELGVGGGRPCAYPGCDGRVYHKNPRMVYCEKCFSRKGKRTYKCLNCGKRFRSKVPTDYCDSCSGLRPKQTCANPKCDRTFRSKNLMHEYCSRKCMLECRKCIVPECTNNIDSTDPNRKFCNICYNKARNMFGEKGCRRKFIDFMQEEQKKETIHLLPTDENG